MHERQKQHDKLYKSVYEMFYIFFREFMKKEKGESNQISRFNTKSLNSITSEVKNLSSTLASLSSCYKT